MGDILRVQGDFDCEAILSLLHDCFVYMEGRIDPPSSLHRLTAQDISDFAAKEHLLIIERRSRPMACIFLTRRPDHIYVGKLAVSSGCRGQGFARMLIEAAVRVALSNGLHFLELQTRIELTENHAAFAKMGFVKTAEGCHPGFDRPTEITMQRRL